MSSRPPWEDFPDDTGGEQAEPWKDFAQETAQSPPPESTWEKVQQASTGLLSGIGRGLSGFAKELPLVGMRAASVMPDIVSGAINTAADVTGLGQDPDIARGLIEKARRDYELRQKFEAPFAEAPDASTAEKIGRGGARVAPQAALAALTGGASIPIQGAVQGAAQGVQSITEGASPESALVSGGMAYLGPWAGGGLNAALSKIKAPFAGSVDEAARAAFERAGVEAPASAITKSPVARNVETLMGKLLGGQRITNRAEKAARELNAAAAAPAGAEAVGAGTRIGEEVAAARRAAELSQQMLEAEKQGFEAAQRTGRQTIEGSLLNPELAVTAGPKSAAGLSAKRKALQQAEDAIWEKADLRPVPVAPSGTLSSIDELLARGDLPPSDLAFLQKFRADIAPKKMIDIGNGPEAVDRLHPDVLAVAEKQGVLPVEIPRSGNEILSQLRGLRQKVPYGAGQGVFGSDAIRKHLAGVLKNDLQTVVSEANPELGQAFAQANALHAGSIEAFKSPWGRQIAKLTQQGQTSKIPEVLGPSMAREEIPRLFEAVGPEAAEGLRANVLDRILGASRDASGQIDPAKVTKELGKWKGNLEQLLGPQQIQDLQRLGVPIPEFPMPAGPALGPPTPGEFLRQKAGKTIEGLYGTGQAGKVPENLIHSRSSAQEIDAVMQAAGPAADEIRANVLARVLKAEGGKEVRLTPEAIAKEINRWGPHRLQQILTEEQYARLQDLVTASRGMGRAAKISEGSQTTPWLKTAEYVTLPQQILTYLLMGNPATALQTGAGVASQAALANFLGRPAGQKWLTTGFGPSVLPGRFLQGAGIGTSRIPSEVEMERRRRELAAALGGE